MMSDQTTDGAAPKALCLFSGGLDSQLAAGLLLRQDIRTVALHFESVFTTERTVDGVVSAREAAAKLGMEWLPVPITDEMIDLVRNPAHGYGSQVNPCIDCRILQLVKARDLMQETGALFLATGEVVGQRPMTQRRNMLRHIEKAAGVEGLVLRPLSALLLEPTRAELNGWVDRTQLCGFSGRQRTPQMHLAQSLGITGYPPPAGGCRLTEPGYARRMRFLLEHDLLRRENLPLLQLGRHFHLDHGGWLVVGREHRENEALRELASPGDRILHCVSAPGPTSLLRGACTDAVLREAARITARYGQARNDEEADVEVVGPDAACLRIRPARGEEFSDRRL